MRITLAACGFFVCFLAYSALAQSSLAFDYKLLNNQNERCSALPGDSYVRQLDEHALELVRSSIAVLGNGSVRSTIPLLLTFKGANGEVVSKRVIRARDTRGKEIVAHELDLASPNAVPDARSRLRALSDNITKRNLYDPLVALSHAENSGSLSITLPSRSSYRGQLPTGVTEIAISGPGHLPKSAFIDEHWFFDKATHLPLAVVYSVPQSSPANLCIRDAHVFSNYSQMDGTLVPATIIATDHHLGDLTISIGSQDGNAR